MADAEKWLKSQFFWFYDQRCDLNDFFEYPCYKKSFSDPFLTFYNQFSLFFTYFLLKSESKIVIWSLWDHGENHMNPLVFARSKCDQMTVFDSDLNKKYVKTMKTDCKMSEKDQKNFFL